MVNISLSSHYRIHIACNITAVFTWSCLISVFDNNRVIAFRNKISRCLRSYQPYILLWVVSHILCSRSHHLPVYDQVTANTFMINSLEQIRSRNHIISITTFGTDTTTHTDEHTIERINRFLKLQIGRRKLLTSPIITLQEIRSKDTVLSPSQCSGKVLFRILAVSTFCTFSWHHLFPWSIMYGSSSRYHIPIPASGHFTACRIGCCFNRISAYSRPTIIHDFQSTMALVTSEPITGRINFRTPELSGGTTHGSYPVILPVNTSRTIIKLIVTIHFRRLYIILIRHKEIVIECS